MVKICDEHKFIFIHIPKNAGTSISSCILGETFGFDMHVIARRLQKELKENRFENYFKFAFIRNPWDRMYSLYTFLQKQWSPTRDMEFTYDEFQNMEFNYWLLNIEFFAPGEDPIIEKICYNKRNQLNWIINEDENIIVDFIGRFENLEDDFNYVLEKLNLPKKQLPQLRKTNHGSYRDVYNEEAKDFVSEHFKKDIEMFGYEF